MDRKNYRIFSRFNENEYSFLLTNKNRKDCCILQNNIIATLDDDDTSKILPSYNKITDCFCCLGIFTNLDQMNYLVVVTTADWVTKLREIDIFKIKNVKFIEMLDKKQEENYEAIGVQKLLESGYFYFGKGDRGRAVDVSVNIQNSQSGMESDDKFIWNKYLLTQFKRFAISNEWYTGITCGSIQATTIYSNSGNIKICVISRVNCQRIGTRFASRGIDDSGNVANFVETEQCFINSDGSQMTSYVQVRGSVPLFWEQPGMQVGSHKIKFSRSVELSSLAYEKHFSSLKTTYKRVEIVNLLGSSEGERKLSQGYSECHENSRFNDIEMVNFDFHKEGGLRSSNIEKFKNKIREFIDESHFCWIVNNEMVQKQFGVVRTNCVDCLDRTNAIQTMIGLDFILEKQLDRIIPNGKSKLASVLENFRAMWKANGDSISNIYAGSGALGTGSRFVDAQKSVKRTYMATFSDSQKNVAILTLLRPNTLKNQLYHCAKRMLPQSVLDMDTKFLTDTIKECVSISDKRDLQVFVGTWNVNGGKNFQSIAHKQQTVTDWLLDLPLHTQRNDPHLISPEIKTDILTDIFAIGFQEIVDLTASNIVNTKSVNQLQWAHHLLNNISAQTEYMLLSTIQLVGICLFVYIKTCLAPFISEVSTASVKTGFKGTVGNKGAVGISLQLYNTSFCFVCSHFAAGQSNFKERNDDYKDIYRGMRFSNGSSIDCHDFVYWCGDFNYRIDKSNNDVKQMIINRNYATLQQFDQLAVQRKLGNVFQGFKEGPTFFAPTYKYDLFCDDYDTSEKCRVPAWTDRVLWKVNLPDVGRDDFCRLLMYNRAELRTSDHRPVAALFSIKALQVNKIQRHDYLIKKMLSYGPRNSTIRVQVVQFQRACDVPDDVLGLIITHFSDVGRIILVRFSGSDVLFNYADSRSVVDAIDKFDQSHLEDTEYFIHVHPLDKDWQHDIHEMLNEDTVDSVEEYPPLLNELIKNLNQRTSVLPEDYFFNEDDEDIKDNHSGSRTRARSCSPVRKDPSKLPLPEKLGEQGSSCANLVEKLTIESPMPKRPPPVRPPPISHSEVIPLNTLSANEEVEVSEDLLVKVVYRQKGPRTPGLGVESDTGGYNRPVFNLSESDLKPFLPAPLVPVRLTSERPLPPRPGKEEELGQRPLPPLPPATPPTPAPRQ